MYKPIHLSPMIPSYNIRETAAFFENLFGFQNGMDSDDYQILYRETFSIHILKAGTDIGQMEFYLEVDAVDPLWDSIKDKLTGIKTRAPFDREYGMREFHIEIPHTNTLLFVGQEIKKQN